MKTTTKKENGYTQHHFCMECKNGARGIYPAPLLKASKSGAGFSTLELLMAFAVLTLSLTAVIMLVFGNQSMAIDTELAQRGTYLAEKNLEEAGIMAHTAFGSVSTTPTSTLAGTPYSTKRNVVDISPCAKQVTDEVFWKRGLRDLGTKLTSVFVSTTTSAALGGDCEAVSTSDDWDNPDIFVDEQITGQADSTGIDVVDEYLYLTTNPGNANDQEEFFVYEFKPGPPIELIQLGARDLGKDTGGGSGSKKVGLLDVDVASDFAYVASASSTAQLQVIDISDPTNPNPVHAVPLPGVDPGGSFPAAITVNYYDEKVYVGTRETDGPEFHVFSVNTGTGLPTHEDSLELNHNVMDIMVQNNYAYLASSDPSRELMVIDVNPSSSEYLEHPDSTGFGFDAPQGGGHHGSAVYVVGDKVYLGRIKASNSAPDSFYILNKSSILDGTEIDDGLLGSKDAGLQNNDAYISGIVVRDRFAFLALESSNIALVIYDISNPSDMRLPAECSEFDSQQHTIAIDMEGDYVFTANLHNADIQIIHDLDALCPTP